MHKMGEEPVNSVRLSDDRSLLIVRVRLVRIPGSCITVDIKDRSLHVDTLKFSKKYCLDLSYPNGIVVKPEDADAELEYGWLKIVLPVVSSDIVSYHATKKKPKKEKGGGGVQAQVEKEKMLEIVEEVEKGGSNRRKMKLQKDTEKANAIMTKLQKKRKKKRMRELMKRERIRELKRREKLIDSWNDEYDGKSRKQRKRVVSFNVKDEVHHY